MVGLISILCPLVGRNHKHPKNRIFGSRRASGRRNINDAYKRVYENSDTAMADKKQYNLALLLAGLRRYNILPYKIRLGIVVNNSDLHPYFGGKEVFNAIGNVRFLAQ